MEAKDAIWRSKKLLFTTFNCAKSQLIPLQAMNGIEDDELVMSLTGLAGGILNNGSTCGVVIGGAVGIAMLKDRDLAGQWTLEDEVQLLREVRERVNWFESRFDTSLCRERDELNYERITVLGLLNPRKAKGCVARAGASMERFTKQHDSVKRSKSPAEAEAARPAEHCATKVLAEIRTQTGVGSKRPERISVALDSGIGLAGGGCGALSGALMALGLRYALDPKDTEPDKLKNIYKAMDSEFFSKARILVNELAWFINMLTLFPIPPLSLLPQRRGGGRFFSGCFSGAKRPKNTPGIVGVRASVSHPKCKPIFGMT